MAQQLNYSVDQKNKLNSLILPNEHKHSAINIKNLNVLEFDDF